MLQVQLLHLRLVDLGRDISVRLHRHEAAQVDRNAAALVEIHRLIIAFIVRSALRQRYCFHCPEDWVVLLLACFVLTFFSLSYLPPSLGCFAFLCSRHVSLIWR